MNIEDYKERRRRFFDLQPRTRTLCLSCFQPEFGCYCRFIQRFDPRIEFIILIHPIEMKRRIATGRMSHLSLENSQLILGKDFSDNARVNRILADKDAVSVMLYPGVNSIDLSALDEGQRSQLFPIAKRLSIFVIDGTWATARAMVRSRNLIGLPRICFSMTAPSRFRVRKQPAEGCYSTIEAIHQTIELLGPGRGFKTVSRRHDALIRVFDTMVERQLQFVKHAKQTRTAVYRREG